MNERAESGFPSSVPEMLISTMHHAQDGRSRFVEVHDEQIKTLIENNTRYTTRVIAEILKI
jgi:hypothetical protein